MSRVLIGNLPSGTTIRNIDEFCSPFGRLLYVDVKNQGNATLACVEYDSSRNAYNLVRARHGYNFNGCTVQMKVMSGESGPFEVRNDSRRKNSPPPPPPPMWSSNNTQLNNGGINNNSNNTGQSSNFDNNRGNNYFPNSNSGSGLSSIGNNLDFNEACRIVYDRFINEGFNPQVAKERTLEFVTNMQGGNNQGFNNNNSDYFGQSQGMNSNNFGNNFDNFNGNQNWGNNFPGNRQMFPNSNWGNSNQQMPSSWGGDGARGGGGMSYPQQRWNSGGNRGNVVNDVRNTVLPRGPKSGPCVDHEGYLQSVTIRKKIESKITKGISTPRDLKNLQFHTQIMEDYERNARRQKKEPTMDELAKLQRYKSALGIVQKYKKLNKSQLSPEDRKSLDKNKTIVDEYENSIALSRNKVSKKEPTQDELSKLQRYKSALGIVQKYKKLNQSQMSPEDCKSLAKNKTIVDEYESYVALSRKTTKIPSRIEAAYERKKQQLLSEAKKSYPYDFTLSGSARKKMRSLVFAGIQANEAKLLALHSSLVVRDLIDLKTGIKKATVANGTDTSKALVLVGANARSAVGKSANARSAVGKSAGAKSGGGVNAKSGADKPKQTTTTANAVDPKLKDMTKKERNYLRGANNFIMKYESKNAEIDSLTNRELALLRKSLKRLQVFHDKYDTLVRKTKYDILLSDKYDFLASDFYGKRETDQVKNTENASETNQTKEGTSESVEGNNETAEVAEGGEGEEVEEVADDQMGDEQGEGQ